MALVPAASGSPELADFLVAQAEVLRLAGAPDQAEASLRQALQFYENRRMTPLAGQTRAALASLTGQGPGALVPWCPGALNRTGRGPGAGPGPHGYLFRACCAASTAMLRLRLAGSYWCLNDDVSACGRRTPASPAGGAA